MQLDKDYDSTSSLNLTDRTGFCIDEHLQRHSLIGFYCPTDNNGNWQPLYFLREDKPDFGSGLFTDSALWE